MLRAQFCDLAPSLVCEERGKETKLVWQLPMLGLQSQGWTKQRELGVSSALA